MPHRDLEVALEECLPIVDKAVRFVCRQHRCGPDEAEEFASVARLKLVEHGHAILRRFEGRSSLKTYLVTVVHRLFIDHRRQRWGTWRPSAAARRLGPVAMRLDTLLHRDGLRFEEACEVIRTTERRDVSLDELDALRGQLPRRTRRVQVGHDEVPEPSVDAAVVEAEALRGEGAAAARRYCRWP